MAENNSSAEYELLRAIEGKTSLAPRTRMGSDTAKDKLRLAFGEFKEKFSHIDFKASFKLADINRGMVVLAVMLALFQIGILVRGVFRINNVPKFDASAVIKATGETKVVKFPLKEYAYYLDAFMGRNIFLETSKAAVVVEASKTSEFEDISRKLRLAGISWLEETGERFAIIEDTEIKATYYLQEKETLRNFTVESIGTNKVILKKDGREIELR